MSNTRAFPKDFVWGVATSAYQVEGAAALDGRKPSIWDRFCETPGKVFDGHTGAVACDQYRLYRDDVDMMKRLGVSAYRFSISWPRVLPDGVGEPNEAGLAYYDRLVDALLQAQIEPWVTLYHWDLPTVLYDKGGWLNRESVDWFEQYTTLIARRLGDRVGNWFTFNEPQIFIGHGHDLCEHAPGEKLSRREILQMSHHVLLAHGRSVQSLRANCAKAPRVGWAPVGAPSFPVVEDEAHIDAARAHMFGVREADWAQQNSWFSDPVMLGGYPGDGEKVFGDDYPKIAEGDMEQIHQPADFFGVNIYSGSPVSIENGGQPTTARRSDGYPVTVFGWAVAPECLYWGVRFFHERYGKPVYITENGLASMDWVHADGKVHDPGRIDYLARHLHGLRRATAEGVDVRGYFQWSMMDNFEWAEGYRKRFGLVYVDYETQERIPKESFYWYANLIRSNGTELPEHLSALR